MSDLCSGRGLSAIEITKARICHDQKPREFNGAVVAFLVKNKLTPKRS